MNWFAALLAGICFATLLAMGCAFVAMKVLPDTFRDMNEQAEVGFKVMAALFVLAGGRLAYSIIRKN